MAAGVASFTIDQNADFAQELIWQDSSGNPIDLTGYSAVMSIASRAGAAPYYTLESTGMDPGITFNPSQGIINLFIPVSVISAWTFQNAVYDLLLTNPSDITIRLLQGPIAVSPGVSTAP